MATTPAATLDPKEKLYAVYNQNRVSRSLEPIVPAQFEMGSPEVYSGPRSPDNTRVKIVPKSPTNSFGTFNLYYSRENLATAFTAQPKVVKGSATTVHQLIAQINEELGINLTTADWLDGPIGASSFTLQATPVNYIFTGSVSVGYYT